MTATRIGVAYVNSISDYRAVRHGLGDLRIECDSGGSWGEVSMLDVVSGGNCIGGSSDSYWEI